MGTLDGKVALVTGASRGIGKAIAIALAAEGADVAVCSRSDGSGSDLPGSTVETAAAVEALGRRAVPIRMDVGIDDEIEAGVEKAQSELGPIDILVNNAVFPGNWGKGAFLDNGVDVLDEAFRINVRGPYALARLLVPEMIERGTGVVANITSGAANHPKPPSADFPGAGAGSLGQIYGTTKAALDRWSTGLAGELYQQGIAVFALNPRFTATERTHAVALPSMNFDVAEPVETTTKAFMFLLSDPLAHTGRVFTSREVVNQYKL